MRLHSTASPIARTGAFWVRNWRLSGNSLKSTQTVGNGREEESQPGAWGRLAPWSEPLMGCCGGRCREPAGWEGAGPLRVCTALSAGRAQGGGEARTGHGRITALERQREPWRQRSEVFTVTARRAAPGPGPGTPCCVPAPGPTSPPATKCKEAIRDSKLYAQLAQITDNTEQNGKNSADISEEPGAKAEYCAARAPDTPRGAGGPPEIPLRRPLNTLPSAQARNQLAPAPSHGSSLSVLTSPAAVGPPQTLPGFLLWLLLNSYWLRSPRALVSNSTITSTHTHLSPSLPRTDTSRLSSGPRPAQTPIVSAPAGQAAALALRFVKDASD